MENNIYWNGNKLLTYGAMINIVIGERGVGKSYFIKKHVIKKAIKTGRKFIYLRRYETELELMFQKGEEPFFKDVEKDPELSGFEFKCNNKVAYCDDEPIGYFMALSRQSHYKSIPFPDVDFIIYDEVFIQNNKYLKNEVTQFLELVETVGRLRNIKVFLLSNFISVANPYFLAFDLSLPYGKDVKLFKEGTIAVCYIKNEAYREAKRETDFGKLIKGTSYERYAIDNEALNDSNSFIKKKTRGSFHVFNIVINGNEYGVWKDAETYGLVVSNDYNTECPILLSFDFNSHTEKTTLARTKSTFFKSLISSYTNGVLFFENQTIKEQVLSLIQKYLY